MRERLTNGRQIELHVDFLHLRHVEMTCFILRTAIGQILYSLSIETNAKKRKIAKRKENENKEKNIFGKPVILHEIHCR